MSSPKEFITALKKTTAARIGIGHAGNRYTTRAQLKFKEDLACARDAVRRELPEALLQKLGLICLKSRATSRRHYLMSTTDGRFLDSESATTLKELALKISPVDIQIIVSEGLSSDAFEKNIPEMLPLLRKRLEDNDLRVAEPLFVQRARVAIMDHIGEILKPRASIILLGERPGLGTSDSLSAYFGFEPCFKRVESDRNVLSNIHSGGIPPTEAALMLAEALIRVLKEEKSGMTIRFDFT